MSVGADDLTIGPDQAVLRVLKERWVTTKGGRRRPTTDSLMDSNFENSCFVEGEIPIPELQRLFPGQEIARIPVSTLRAQGYWLERRPDEAPEGCIPPESHCVCGPPDTPERGVYEAKARKIVKAPEVEILR